MRQERSILLAIFNGGFNRRGEIVVVEGVCDSCGEKRIVVLVDASEGEYRAGTLCIDCFKKGIEDYKKIQS